MKPIVPPPSGDWPRPPAGGWLYRVAYVDKHRRTRQRLFRQEKRARDFAVDVVLQGGNPRLDKVRLRGWEEFAKWL